MTKIKLAYYSKWKKLRQIADTTMRNGAIKAKWQLGDEEIKEFYQWLKEKVYPLCQSYGTYPFATDIISLRKMFIKDRQNNKTSMNSVSCWFCDRCLFIFSNRILFSESFVVCF